jgi:hypothetical protein
VAEAPQAGPAVTERYVGILTRAVDDLVEKHQLTFMERAVFVGLVLLVDYRTGVYTTTLAALAERLRLTPRHLRPKLDRLAELGLIERSFPRGHDGWMRVLVYLDVVHLPPAQRENHPLRNGRFVPYVKGARVPYDHGAIPATKDETSLGKGRNVPYEQDPPVCTSEIHSRVSGLPAENDARSEAEERDQRATAGRTLGAIRRAGLSQRPERSLEDARAAALDGDETW